MQNVTNIGDPNMFMGLKNRFFIRNAGPRYIQSHSSSYFMSHGRPTFRIQYTSFGKYNLYHTPIVEVKNVIGNKRYLNKGMENEMRTKMPNIQ